MKRTEKRWWVVWEWMNVSTRKWRHVPVTVTATPRKLLRAQPKWRRERIRLTPIVEVPDEGQ